MANNQTNTATTWKILFRILPVIGLILIGIGTYWAVKTTSLFNTVVFSTVGLGVFLFLTLFVKAEVANIKYYLNVFAYSIFVGTICVVGYMFARNHSKQIDLTGNKFFSLSDQSKKVLKSLKQDIEIAVFMPTGVMFTDLQELYAAGGGDKKVKWTFIDPVKEPLKTKDYGENIGTGTVVVKGGAKKKQFSVQSLLSNAGAIAPDAENTLTNAIIEVSRDKELKVYFTTGHGELALEGKTPSSIMRQQTQSDEPTLEQFKKHLADQALVSEPLNLLQKGFVPEDAALVVLAGPQTDLLPNEVAALEKYLNADGKMLVTLDVPVSSLIQSPPLTNIKGLLKKYGVDAPDKVVLDTVGQQMTNHIEYAIMMWMNPEQAITSNFARRMVLQPVGIVRPIKAATDVPTAYQVEELLKSSSESWAEDFTALAGGRLTMPAQRDEQPFAVAVSPAGPPPSQPGMPPPPPPKGGMRLVVFGTSTLISDVAQKSSQLSIALMMNTVNWLTQQEDLIAIPPRKVAGTPIILASGQLPVIFFVAVLLIPGVLFFGGVSYSLLRRRR